MKSIEETPIYSISCGKIILVMIVITLILFHLFHLLIPKEEPGDFRGRLGSDSMPPSGGNPAARPRQRACQPSPRRKGRAVNLVPFPHGQFSRSVQNAHAGLAFQFSPSIFHSVVIPIQCIFSKYQIVNFLH